MAKKKVKKKTPSKKKSIASYNPPQPVKVNFHTSKKRSPEFEQALEQEAQAAEFKKQKELAKAGRQQGDSPQGPGAQDQPESTVPPKAARALAPVLKIPFAIWSNIEEIPEIRLSNEEAQEWADPIVDILEYYFPGKIPEIAWMWLMLLESTGRVIDSRIEIRHQKKKELSAASQADRGPAVSSPLSANQPAPAHNGAEPADDYPKENG